jgi:hypothetical protein
MLTDVDAGGRRNVAPAGHRGEASGAGRAIVWLLPLGRSFVHWRGEYSGGNSGWETWDLLPADEGASVTVEMEVVPAGGALVRVAADHFVQRPMRRNVHQSLGNLMRLVETA